MKWIKKATNIFLIVVLALGFSVGSLALTPPQQTYAIGVIGSNAVKQLVYGTWEKAGIQFGSKDAKERAFDAWNMKAHEKWQADEAAGRNQDLWDNFNAIAQGRTSPVKNPLDDAPGMGKVLLDWTFAGMAIGIGAEIGLSIEENQLNQTRMAYLGNYVPPYEGVSYNGNFSVTYGKEFQDGSFYKTDVLIGGRVYATLSSPYKEDPVKAYHISGFEKKINTDGNPYYKLDARAVSRTKFGEVVISDYFITVPAGSFTNDTGGQKYEMIPRPDHVPNIAIPQPLQDLARADIGEVPAHIPSTKPLEVIVPLDDTIWDGTLNPPYEVPDPNTPPEDGTNPDEDTDAPPGTNPGGDTDAPPGTDPGGDTDAPPGTDPDGDTDAPPKEDEETPPGKDEEQPPKEDEENSCDASLKKPDFKKVGVAFTHAFPFSLPWDLKRFFDAAFSGIGSEKPSVDLTFLGDGVTLTIPDYFDSWVDIAKNLMVIMFDISLIWMFARFMQRGGGD